MQHLISWDYQASRCSKASFDGIKAFPYVSPSIYREVAMMVRRTSHLEASSRSPPLIGNMVRDKNAQAVSDNFMVPHPISLPGYAEDCCLPVSHGVG